ncbi:SH3 and multiple ankyrin repeat domains protein 1-like isoform X2 [Balamuthia mandrillaris]
MDLEELGMGVPDGAHSEEDEEVTARLSDHHAHHPQHHHAHHHQQHQHHDQHSKGVMLDSRYHHPHQLSHHRTSSPPMAGHDGSSQDHDAGQDHHQHNHHQHTQGGSFAGDGSSASNVADGTSGGDFHSTGYGYHHPDHMLPPHHLTGHHLPQSQHSMADHQSVAASAWLPSLTNTSMGGGVDQQGGGQVMYYYPGFMAHPHQQPHHVHPYGGSAGAPMPPQFSPDFMHHHTGMHPHAYDRGMAQPQHPHSHHPHHPHHHQMQLLQAAEHGIPHLAPGASSPASSSPSSSIISAVSKSKKGDGGKRKRQRTTPEQLEVLEKEFSISPTPAREVRHRLSLELMMTPRQVQVWFQNKRAKEKKIARKSGNAYTFQSASSSATSNSTTSSNSNNTDSPNEAHSPPQYHQPQPGSPPSYHPHQPLTFNPHDNHHHNQYSSDGSPTTTTAAHPHFPMPHHLPHPPHYQHPSQNYPQLPFAMNMASHVEGGYEALLIGSDERQYSKQDSGGGLGELRNYAESLAVKIQNQCLAANRAIFAFRTDKQQSDWAALMEAVNTIAREVDNMRDHLDPYFKRAETSPDESKLKDGDAWWTPVFTLLHFITDLYQNNFLDDDTELVNNARCEVDKAVFGLWTQACSIFFPHMTVAQCKRWTETATTLDPSGYLSFEGDLKEVELTKRYQEFERLRTIKSYKSFLARANPAQHEQIRERVMASIDPQNVDLRSIILLNHQLYDEVINEIEQHPSSAFIRQNIIGDAPSHSQQLLCYKRPQYVINKAEEVLQKQLAVVLDALFLRFIKTSDLKRLFEKRNSNEFLKALQASLEEEARANPPEPPVNGDFLWHNNNQGEEQEHEEKKAKEEDRDKPDAITTHPHANFYSGIEGWLNCARMAFNVLATSKEEEAEEEEQDEEEKNKRNKKKEEESRKKAENGFKEFCKKLEEFFLEKAKEKEDKNGGGAEKMVELCCQYVRLASEAADSNEDDESNEEAEDDNHAKNKKKKGTKRKRESPTTPTSIGYGVGPWFSLMKLVAAVRGRTLWTLVSLRR